MLASEGDDVLCVDVRVDVCVCVRRCACAVVSWKLCPCMNPGASLSCVLCVAFRGLSVSVVYIVGSGKWQ